MLFLLVCENLSEQVVLETCFNYLLLIVVIRPLCNTLEETRLDLFMHILATAQFILDFLDLFSRNADISEILFYLSFRSHFAGTVSPVVPISRVEHTGSSFGQPLFESVSRRRQHFELLITYRATHDLCTILPQLNRGDPLWLGRDRLRFPIRKDLFAPSLHQQVL